jgi:ABC-type nitrate/sulfonate/bicarbonate transport system permease component
MIGGTSGVLIGRTVALSSTVAHGALRFLRHALWAPLLLYPALPLSLIDRMYHPEYVRFGLLIMGSVAALVLSSCYHYLNAVIALDLKSPRQYYWKEILLHALMLVVLSQTWMGEYGWPETLFVDSEGLALWIGVLTVILIFMVLVNSSFAASFEQSAALRAASVLYDMRSKRRVSLLVAFLFTAVLIIIWQALSLVMQHLDVSPLAVAKSIYYLFLKFPPPADSDVTIWHDLKLSLVEVISGLFLGGLAGILVESGMRRNAAVYRLVSRVLPLTYLVPLAFPVLLLYLGVLQVTSHTIAVVAALSFYPFTQAFWGLRKVGRLRLLFAVDDALPFAFVAMLVGETMNATGGLGFLMIKARSDYRVTEAVGIAAVLVGLLAILSCSLRVLTRHVPRSQAREPFG